MSREVYTHRVFTGALVPGGDNGRRRQSKREAMVCFGDAATHGRRDQDRVFLEVRRPVPGVPWDTLGSADAAPL